MRDSYSSNPAAPLEVFNYIIPRFYCGDFAVFIDVGLKPSARVQVSLPGPTRWISEPGWGVSSSQLSSCVAIASKSYLMRRNVVPVFSYSNLNYQCIGL